MTFLEVLTTEFPLWNINANFMVCPNRISMFYFASVWYIPFDFHLPSQMVSRWYLPM